MKKDSIFIPKRKTFKKNIAGEVCAESPSNIALVKYWGKKAGQIPENPSISYTLNKCKTKTCLQYIPKKQAQQKIEVFLEGVLQPKFNQKIESFIQRIRPYCPWITEYDFVVKTENTFPHSSGIASSASGMSALAKCFMKIETEVYDYLPTESEHKVSFLSRLGSGSACRSVYPGLVLWGESEYYNKSSDLYAIPLDSKDIHPLFKTMKDCILLIHEGTKSVSSTAGHNLMRNHPYAQTRFFEAKKAIGRLKTILKQGDIQSFGELIEHEAMSLHALMMISSPPYLLMQEGTIKTLQKVWDFRRETKRPLYFTLDAGANVHLLYPGEQQQPIEDFIEKELIAFTANQKAIYDSLAF